MATQQYLPRGYGGSRYAGASLGVPYVSAYDPSVAGRYAGLMQQEYGKAISANQALALREGEIGDIMTQDIEGREDVLGKYKGRIDKIKEAYNQDLALAAPELARTIVEERSNPWYAKNVRYNKEFERRQKLIDQFGPNLQFTRDLPTGRLQDMEMEDIGFEYYNRQHLQQLFQEQFGKQALRKGDLELSDIPGYPGFVKTSQQLGLNEIEVAQLGEEQAYGFIEDSLEGMGLSPTPENIAMLRREFDDWAGSNLIRGAQESIKPRPTTTGGGSDLPFQLFPEESQLVKVEEEREPTPSRVEAKKEGRDIMDRYNSKELTFEEQVALEQNPDLVSEIENTPLKKSFTSNVGKVFKDSDIKDLIVSELRSNTTSIQSAFNGVTSALEKVGLLEVFPLAGEGGSTLYKLDGEPENLSQSEYRKIIKPLTSEYGNMKSYSHSEGAKQLARRVTAEVNKMVETGIYAISGDANVNVKQYFENVMLAATAKNLSASGVYITKGSGKDKDFSEQRSERKLNSLKNLKNNIRFGTVTYRESGPKGKPPELVMSTNEGNVHIPLKGEQGDIHGMQLSLLTTDPKIINDVFNASYDEILSKKGGSIPVGEAFGDPSLKIPGMTNIYRIDSDGQRMYVAPVGDNQLQASTPNELLQRIAAYVNLLTQQGAMQVQNPTLEFLVKRVSQLMTPKERKETNLGAIQSLMQFQ